MTADPKTVLRTRHGDVQILMDRWNSDTLQLAPLDDEDLDITINLEVPGTDASTGRMANGACARFNSYGGQTPEELRKGALLMAVAADIADLFNEANADALEAARKEQAELEAERERKAAEHAERVKERKDLLLTELLDERVKIRERGMKSMVYAKVVARELGDGSWEPRFEWTTEHVRTQNLSQIVRLDVKANNRWENVWDDGLDDLSQWDRDLKGPAKPTPYTYDGSRRD